MAATAVQRRWQIGLIVGGVLLLVVGGLVLLADVSPGDYLGILAWFAGAIILHDGILAPATLLVAVALRRAGRRIPWGAIVIVQGAIVVGGVMALVVFPQIYKRGIGTNNPTVLPLDYGLNLAIFYAILVIVTAIAVAVYVRVRPDSTRLRPAA